MPSLRTLHRQGRILTCGATAGFDPKEDLRFIWTFELNIRGSNGWMREDLIALLDLVGSGKLKTVIDRELSLPETNEAFRIAGGSRRCSAKCWSSHERSTLQQAVGGRSPGDLRPLAVHRMARPEGGLALDHERQEITVRMEMRPELERRPGTRQFHGGPIAAFIDVVGDFAIGMLVGGGVPTMNFRTDYLRPAIGNALTAVAPRPPRGQDGRRLSTSTSLDDEARLVALGRGTYSSNAG